MSGRSSVPFALACALILLVGGPSRAERVKDLARVHGMRNNQLVGYGLVVGLNQTGDDLNVPFTQQSILTLLRRMGSPAVDPQLLRTRDAAAVLVTALVPPFARSGTQVDVNVAALGSARSLQGGLLISTPLRSADGRVFAVAQGPVLVGGMLAQGMNGSLSLRNHVTTGRIPDGAILERDLPNGLKPDVLTFLLKSPDFTTATRMAAVVEKSLAPGPPTEQAPASPPADPQAPVQAAPPTATAPTERRVRVLDAGTVEIRLGPADKDRVVALVAQLEELEVEPDVPARVVVNERSGVVVIGSRVRLAQAAVSFGKLNVRIEEGLAVSQPAMMGMGSTVVMPQSRVEQTEERVPVRLIGPAAKVEDVVQTLNQLGASTRELVAILQTLKAAGALRGELLIE